MNKLTIFSIIYLISFQSMCQDFNTLLTRDTIYIPFKGNKKNKKIVFDKGLNNYKDRHYYIRLKDNTNMDFNLIFANNKITFGTLSDNLMLKKKQIKKLQIVNFNIFKKMQKCELDKVFSQRKVFYIIDYTEKDKSKISIYQVLPYRICETMDD